MYSFEELRGKACLVTGASGGIGAAVARGFGACGARVAVHGYRNQEAAKAVVQSIVSGGGEAVAVQGDLSDIGTVERIAREALAAFGQIDVLVNNAGGPVQRAALEETPAESYELILDINLTSLIAMCRTIIPVMKRQGSGVILNTTSPAARMGGGPGTTVYAAAKGGVSALTRGLARELAPSAIRVNAISPGYIATPLHSATPRAALDSFIAATPLRRAGTPEDCVGAFLFLACERLSSFITGQTIEVNGGFIMP